MSRLINDWAPETRSLLRTLTKHRLELVASNNGDTRAAFTESAAKVLGWTDVQDLKASEAKLVGHLTACDEATLYVRVPSGKLATLMLVYGNDPGELVSDHCDVAILRTVADEHADNWYRRQQPKKNAL